MKALVWHNPTDIRCDEVPDPKIEHPRDAIIRVTTCAICGSDLHLYNGYMPGMQNGDIIGHEFMGEVMEVGPETKGALKVGDRIVVPFTIFCGECEQCRRGNFSVCETTNRNKDMAAKVFGRHDRGPLRLHPPHRRLCRRPGRIRARAVCRQDPHQGDEQRPYRRAGPVSRRHLPDRLAGRGPVRHRSPGHGRDLGRRTRRADGDPLGRAARREAGDLRSTASPSASTWRAPAAPITINFDEESVIERLEELTHGKGPEKCIDCVGMEAHITSHIDSMYDRVKQAVMAESDRPHVLREMIYVCRPAGTLSIPGVYGGLVDKIPFGAAMNKGLTWRMGQTHVNRWTDDLLRRIGEGQIDPSFVITHTVPIEQGPEMYQTFRDKQDGCIKVVLKP